MGAERKEASSLLPEAQYRNRGRRVGSKSTLEGLASPRRDCQIGVAPTGFDHMTRYIEVDFGGVSLAA